MLNLTDHRRVAGNNYAASGDERRGATVYTSRRTDSLDVATAAALAFYERLRSRGCALK
jgi:hypothetical protein